ncbi:hypothetical protein C2S53_004192 [Perilla frutescens var. hirtella]|uniref:Cystatin domain-containing protein n=1 Tax=Perilla frutescens var. hirtella TaxID=608512 RepID=A0AAD4JIK8_PERFH|nr:hypothetical protein C2S53_004192 [Perilla frutescens var. hirtella]
MAPKSSLTLFVFLSLLAVVIPILAVTGKPFPPVGWQPIENPNSSIEVVRAATFAVAEHNRLAQTQLVFKTVEEAEWQHIGGNRFRLVISAMDGAAAAAPPKNHTAIVWEILDIHLTLHLLSFQ